MPPPAILVAFSQADANNNRIRRVDMATGLVITLAGGGSANADGQGTSAGFNQPVRIAIDGAATVALVVSIRWRSPAGACLKGLRTHYLLEPFKIPVLCQRTRLSPLCAAFDAST